MKEGYLQNKVKNLNEEIEILNSKLDNLKIEINKIEKIKEEIKIEDLKKIKEDIEKSDIIKFKDEITTETINRSLDTLEKYFKGIFSKLNDKISHKINNITVSELHEYIKEQGQGICNLQINTFNELILYLNESYKLKIPQLEPGQLMDNKSEVKRWLRKAEIKNERSKKEKE